ncbi:MAG: WecB/TagA/CpsF family glycosyltransferase, partial [Bacteroidota bacterium]
MDERIKIFDVSINNISYADLELAITKNLLEKRKLIIGYCTAHKLNLAYSNTALKAYLKQFDLLHPDGIGIFLASKFLYGNSGLKHRVTGSDFYPLLANAGVKKDWKFFFLGDTDETLRKISRKYPLMKIAGIQNGYNFETDLVNKKINESNVDILIVGLGSPLQEKWIIDNKEKLDTKIILAVGGGIK